MNLAEALATPPTKGQQGPRCSVGRALSSLTGADLEAFKSALADEAWNAEALEVAMDSAGHRLGAGSVKRHRRGLCRCEK